jgi:hypothetical protein
MCEAHDAKRLANDPYIEAKGTHLHKKDAHHKDRVNLFSNTQHNTGHQKPFSQVITFQFRVLVLNDKQNVYHITHTEEQIQETYIKG